MALTPVPINATTVPGGASIQTDQIGGDSYEVVKQAFGVEGVATMVSAADPLPVTGEVAVTALPAGLATSANQQTDALTDAELRATPVPVSGTVTVDTSLLSTSAKQDSQTALLTTLNSLIETNNYLVQFLSQLTGAMNSGAPALRVAPISSQSTAVTGTLTGVTTVATVTNLTNFGTGIPAKEMADDMNNLIVTMANINNANA